MVRLVGAWFQFQSALPLRGATGWRNIGIRAVVISIRAPLAGSDAIVAVHRQASARFQSALPLRGATISPCMPRTCFRHFNPRSPCGERPLWRSWTGPPCRYFNPRSPCGERLVLYLRDILIVRFQSALPLRGATSFLGELMSSAYISIRAPLAGSDAFRIPGQGSRMISIRAPLAGSDRYIL